jgi:hypothetical protein
MWVPTVLDQTLFCWQLAIKLDLGSAYEFVLIPQVLRGHPPEGEFLLYQGISRPLHTAFPTLLPHIRYMNTSSTPCKDCLYPIQFYNYRIGSYLWGNQPTFHGASFYNSRD